MTEIRAFVGHSFNKNDEAVVQKFLKIFDRLSKSELNFSWQSAEPAEPKELADKVKALLFDKNVFIGICTKKERVIESDLLTKGIFRPSYLMAPEEKFLWKTSDWIIQEIGLAIGKGLDLILLLENGVQRPGRLQGDVEYIPFDRESPDESFGKILEMITALSPRDSSLSAVSSDTGSMPTEENGVQDTPESQDWSTPQPGWSRRDYEIAYFKMTLLQDTAGIAAIDKSYLETNDAAQGDNKISWEAHAEHTRLAFGKGGSLRKLEAMAEENPDNRATLGYLARGYEKYEDYAKAASTYEAAASKATDCTQARGYMGLAAENYVRAGEKEIGLQIISQMKIQVEESGNGELQVLNMLRNIAEFEKEDETLLAIMERIVDVDPSDNNMRFSLAYKHSSIGNDELALLHYHKIPYRERVAMTWNNVGVQFDEFSMPAKSVDAYRQAEEMGETLAMSNLAAKFISAGFLFEAQEQCDEALKIKDFHKNIGGNLAKLKSVPDMEDEKEAEVLEKAKPKSDFYKQLGRAASRPDPGEIADHWEGPDCVLDITLDGETFRAVGSYERQRSGLLGALIQGSVGIVRDKNDQIRFRVEYIGTLRGRVIEAKVTRTKEDETPKIEPTLLGSSGNETKVLMTLADDESEFKVMECFSGGGLRFYTLKRRAKNG